MEGEHAGEVIKMLSHYSYSTAGNTASSSYAVVVGIEAVILNFMEKGR